MHIKIVTGILIFALLLALWYILKCRAELRKLRTTGSVVPADMETKPVPEQTGQELKSYLSFILDQIPVPIHIKEVEEEYKFVYWNEASTNMFGVNAINETIEYVVDDETARKLHHIDEEVFRTGKAYQQRETITTRDGIRHETIVHKGLIKGINRNLIITVRSDVGQKLYLEDQLEKAYAQGQLIINNANSGLAYISADYIVQWENFSSLPQYQYETYHKGQLCYKSAYNRTQPCENCVLQRAMTSHRVEQIEFNLENGETLEIFATPILSPQGEVEGVVIRADNCTERKKMIQALEKAKEKAEESDHLKMAFLANMSHEIRTPLNAIVGFSNLLLSTTNEAEKQEYVNIISSNNDLLLQLINDILDLSRIEAGEMNFSPSTFSVGDALNELVTMQEYRLRSAVTINLLHPQEKNCHVTLDRGRLVQIATNFLTNAVKFTSEGSITLSYHYENNGLWISVTDTGAGIAEDFLPRIFDRFEKQDSFIQGTGLGLPICKAIMDAQNGKIEVESTLGKGSTFRAWFPCPVITQTEEVINTFFG